jgi:hypothetical protein
MNAGSLVTGSPALAASRTHGGGPRVAARREALLVAVFGRDLPNPPVALFLPIAPWAAVRLGPGGVAASCCSRRSS